MSVLTERAEATLKTTNAAPSRQRRLLTPVPVHIYVPPIAEKTTGDSTSTYISDYFTTLQFITTSINSAEDSTTNGYTEQRSILSESTLMNRTVNTTVTFTTGGASSPTENGAVKLGGIIGGVGGTLLFLLVVVIVLSMLLKYRKRQNSTFTGSRPTATFQPTRKENTYEHHIPLYDIANTKKNTSDTINEQITREKVVSSLRTPPANDYSLEKMYCIEGKFNPLSLTKKDVQSQNKEATYQSKDDVINNYFVLGSISAKVTHTHTGVPSTISQWSAPQPELNNSHDGDYYSEILGVERLNHTNESSYENVETTTYRLNNEYSLEEVDNPMSLSMKDVKTQNKESSYQTEDDVINNYFVLESNFEKMTDTNTDLSSINIQPSTRHPDLNILQDDYDYSKISCLERNDHDEASSCDNGEKTTVNNEYSSKEVYLGKDRHAHGERKQTNRDTLTKCEQSDATAESIIDNYFILERTFETNQRIKSLSKDDYSNIATGNSDIYQDEHGYSHMSALERRSIDRDSTYDHVANVENVEDKYGYANVHVGSQWSSEVQLSACKLARTVDSVYSVCVNQYANEYDIGETIS